MTPDERLDYEFEREFHRLRDLGLVLQTTDALGGVVWMMTLRGVQEISAAEPKSDSGS